MTTAPWPKAPRHLDALSRLLGAISELPDGTPCRGVAGFIDEDAAVLRAAAVVCDGCPVWTLCDEAGKWERGGIWAGEIRTVNKENANRKEAAA